MMHTLNSLPVSVPLTSLPVSVLSSWLISQLSHRARFVSKTTLCWLLVEASSWLESRQVLIFLKIIWAVSPFLNISGAKINVLESKLTAQYSKAKSKLWWNLIERNRITDFHSSCCVIYVFHLVFLYMQMWFFFRARFDFGIWKLDHASQKKSYTALLKFNSTKRAILLMFVLWVKLYSFKLVSIAPWDVYSCKIKKKTKNPRKAVISVYFMSKLRVFSLTLWSTLVKAFHLAHGLVFGEYPLQSLSHAVGLAVCHTEGESLLQQPLTFQCSAESLCLLSLY